MAYSVEIPPKRRQLYDYLLKLSNLERPETVSESQITETIQDFGGKLNSIIEPFPKYLTQLVVGELESLERLKTLERIEDLSLLERCRNKIAEITSVSEEETTYLKRLEGLFDLRISQLRAKMEPSPASREDLPRLLEQFNTILDDISKKITFTETIEERRGEEDVYTLSEGLCQLSRLTNQFISAGSESYEEIMESLARKLKYGDALFALAQIKRAFGSKRIDEGRYRELMIDEAKQKLVEGLIIKILDLSGPQTLKEIHETSRVSERDLFMAAMSLVNKKKVEIVGEEGVHPIYSTVEEERSETLEALKTAIKGLNTTLKVSKVKNEMLGVVVSKCEDLVKELEEVGPIEDKLFEKDAARIGEICPRIIEYSLGVERYDTLGTRRERLEAVLNACMNFRLSFIAEKGSQLTQKNVYGEPMDESRYLELLSSFIDAEYERELILHHIRSHGPTTVPQIAEATDLPTHAVNLYLIGLKQLGSVQIEGEKSGYILYDIPRKPQKEVLEVESLLASIFTLHQGVNRLPHLLEDLGVEAFNIISTDLDAMKVAVDKLAVLIVYDERSKTSLADLRSGIENALSLLVEARERIPKAGPRVSLEELGTVLVPEVDSEYADLVELKPLAGFGIVEWDGKRCLGCNSCPEICPEASLSLKPVWDASTVFEMTEDEMEEMPESRRMIYQSMRRIALRKPTEPIKLPEETLGFGEVDYNLIKCIACGRCEKRCPNKAIAVREIWNFSEVMRILTQR